MDRVELLKKLALTPGVSGFEQEIRQIMQDELKELALCRTDNLGSVVFEFQGQPDQPRIMFIAHMDEAGFIVADLLEDGLIKFQAVGGWDPDNMFSGRVEIINAENDRIPGFLSAGPTAFQKNPPKKPFIDNLYIDIGATSRQELVEIYRIQIGDQIAMAGTCYYNENSRRMLGKSFDDRAGLAALIELGKKMPTIKHNNTVYCVGSAQEAIGLRGAKTIAQYTDADLCFVVEGAPADDMPGVSAHPQICLGKGAHVRLYDPSLVVKKELKEFVLRIAKDHNIKIQPGIRKTGATDGSEIYLANHGVPSIVLAVPVRNIDRHSCCGSIVSMDDIGELIKLLVKIAENLDRDTLKKIL